MHHADHEGPTGNFEHVLAFVMLRPGKMQVKMRVLTVALVAMLMLVQMETPSDRTRSQSNQH
jgi:hypothetical protein